MNDIQKRHFLGEVEYAQHNFARLRPLLHSLNGRRWEGHADRAWFPNSGLVFSLSPDLRFAPSGSLWVFQVRPNERVAHGEDKDAFITIQVKPATRFLTDLEPRGPEALRRFATDEGFEPGSSVGGVLLPELDDHWVLATELERGEDRLARVTNERLLPHMRVLRGSPADLAGIPTADGRWALPVLSAGLSCGIRNWLPPTALIERLAADLRRWIPHGPHKARAASAAAALRELAPALDGLAALKSTEARAALDRSSGLIEDAAAFTDHVEALVETLMTAPSVAREIDRERAAIRQKLEAEALSSVERLEADARERLREEQAAASAALAADKDALERARAETETARGELGSIQKRIRTETASFTKSLEGLINRARTEPAAYAAEWLGRMGIAGAGASPDVVIDPTALETPADVIAIDQIGLALHAASPISAATSPIFLMMDCAIRARELVVGIGPKARQVIAAWTGALAPSVERVAVADPTLLAFAELTPSGPRGAGAPLARAIARARATPERPVVALLDDIDVAAGSFWLPEAARAARSPRAHGLPENLILIGLIEGDPGAARLTQARVGELAPLTFADQTLTLRAQARERVELPLDALAPPITNDGVAPRLANLRTAGAHALAADDLEKIVAGFESYFEWTKNGAAAPDELTAAGSLARAARALIMGGE